MILRTGKADENVIDRSVVKRLGDVRKTPETTGMRGILSDPVSVRTRHVGFLSVTGAVNSLAAAGIRPELVQADVLLPVGTDESVLRFIEDEIRDAAELAGVTVTDGSVVVTSAVTRPVAVARAEGSRNYCYRSNREEGMLRPGDSPCPVTAENLRILLAGHIGLEGTWLLSEEKAVELERQFPVQMVQRCRSLKDRLLITPAAEALGQLMCGTEYAADTLSGTAESSAEPSHGARDSHIHGIFPENVSEGGIYAALWKLSEQLQCGFEVSLPEILISQETIEFCNYYGINPYQMRSSGCLLAACEESSSVQIIRCLEDHGIPAAVIGRTFPGRDRILINGEERQFLNRPAPDALIPVLG